jgi:predicted transcriptional regulator of viral defense system
MAGRPLTVKAMLERHGRPALSHLRMSKRDQDRAAAERAERLAEQLRANLRKRKAQARAMAGDKPGGDHRED